MSGEFLKRVGCKVLREKICKPSDLFHHLKNGISVALSGFTPIGYPKEFPIGFANFVKENGLEGTIVMDLYSGASFGANVEDLWAELGITRNRFPYQAGRVLAQRINSGTSDIMDLHLSNYATQVANGFYNRSNGGNFEVGIIEVTAITEDGEVVLGGSVGIIPEIIQRSDKLIIEINPMVPVMDGFHDLLFNIPPPNTPTNLFVQGVADRIGTPALKVDPDKVIGVIEGTIPDAPVTLAPTSSEHQLIAKHLIDFFEDEVSAGRLPAKKLLPLQSGVGNIANAVVDGLGDSDFEDLELWTEVIQDTTLDLIDSGKAKFVSGCSLTLSEEGTERFFSNMDYYKDKIVLRPCFISNGAINIKRLGCIAMNTPVEFDIYGNANSTHVNGTRIINGIGGSGDFLRNSYMSIIHAPSARGTDNAISGIVPLVSHCDHTEHDVSIFVTEQGLADCRGMTPRERQSEIIKKCVHPDYKEQLKEYYDICYEETIANGVGHTPMSFKMAFKMHINLLENGTMKLDSWD